MKPKIITVTGKKKLKRIETHTIPSKEWIVRYSEYQKVEHRGTALKWSLRAFGITLFCTFGLYLMQGFHLWGFNLPTAMLNGLGVGIVGQIGGLVAVAFKFVFR